MRITYFSFINQLLYNFIKLLIRCVDIFTNHFIMELGEKSLPSRGLKQVKVDNWGTFFLQRLQQIYADEELFDLKIRFPTSEITVQVNITRINSIIIRIYIIHVLYI